MGLVPHIGFRFSWLSGIATAAIGPFHPEYSLTEDGRRLCEAIVPLVRWAEKRDNLPAKTCHATCTMSAGCPSRRAGR
jgi:hypothetical protein